MSRHSMLRIDELLADRASSGLDPRDTAELDALLLDNPEADDGGYDRAAAAVLLAGLEAPVAMPASLLDHIVRDGESMVAPDRIGAVIPIESARPRGWLPFTGWIAAAAAVAVAVFAWTQWREALNPGDPVRARTALIAEAGDVVPVPWTGTEDPAVGDAGGDVVWSADRQTGFMRIRGLAANDPDREQYQLWIFDKDRDERYPVDGGVFDVPEGTDEVVVPIRAKLRVDEPVLFAVTVERPGGVVVSSRERIVLVGDPTGG